MSVQRFAIKVILEIGICRVDALRAGSRCKCHWRCCMLSVAGRQWLFSERLCSWSYWDQSLGPGISVQARFSYSALIIWLNILGTAKRKEIIQCDHIGKNKELWKYGPSPVHLYGPHVWIRLTLTARGIFVANSTSQGVILLIAVSFLSGFQCSLHGCKNYVKSLSFET